VLLAVSDNGVGMSPEVLERAFEPFFTTKEVEKGTGLGLSMVYGFVKQSGGHIKIYSEVDHGTTVKIYLPCADGAEMVEPGPKATETATARGHELILVVEDNEGMRNVTLKQLRDLGYRTLEAENAKQALAILESHAEIDLLFTDIVMPGGMNGIELAREASMRRPGLRILLTSGYTAHAMTNGYHDIKGLELLSKPFRKTDLGARLKALLERSDQVV
jgi:CheY-like chemotaxis protein